MNNPLNMVDPSGLCCDSNDVNHVNDVNDSNDCNWDNLVSCIGDATDSLSKCVDRVTKKRDYYLAYCDHQYKECMKVAKGAPIVLRQFLEAWGLDLAGCLAVYAVDLRMCYEEYCPQLPGPIIPPVGLSAMNSNFLHLWTYN
jgi:hypothetical protein